jgi:ornithine cyclodeaminase
MQMSQQLDRILYLSRRDVEHACRCIDPVAAVAEALRLHGQGEVVLPDEAYLTWADQDGHPARSLNMPGFLGGSLCSAGTKIINANPRNPDGGLPRASGLTLLFDTNSARITCVMEAAYISSLRTASVTALAVDLLASAPVHSLALLGAGALAHAHLELLLAHLPTLREVMVFDAVAGRAEALLHQVRAGEARLRVATSAEETIRSAQLVVAVTTTTEGYIPFDWLQRGALLVNVSLDDPLPEVVLNADRVIVDDWQLVSHDTRRLLGRMVRQGLLAGPDEPSPADQHGRCVDAELGAILTGRAPGRRHADEIILVNPFGLSIEDLAVATRVYAAACQLQLGVYLDR